MVASFIASSISYDIFSNNISNKEFNLKIAEDANKSSMSISGFLYDSGCKGYGAYQNDRYDYEEHQRNYEKRRADIESLKNKRNIISFLIVVAGIAISALIYKKANRAIPQDYAEQKVI